MDDPYATLLGRVFDDAYADDRATLSDQDYARLRFDFIFHMTDWLDDLGRLNQVVSSPQARTTEEASGALMGFLIHAIPHLKAAGRILVGPPHDAFEDDQTSRLIRKHELGEVQVG